MAINFETVGSSARDEESGMFIPAPRMEPIELADGSAGIEFQYSFLLNGEFVGALAIPSTRHFAADHRGGAWVFELDFTDDSEIGAALRLKSRFAAGQDDFSFVRDIAKGLISVFAGATDNVDAQSTSIFTTVAALARRGIHIPSEVVPDADGRIILADVFVPAHPIQSAEE